MTDSPLGLPARPASKSDAAENLLKDDLPTLMRKAAEMERNLKGKSADYDLPQVASGGSYL